eukprot:CAMPEP_0113571330 /NCGR_PEP_ID=MMETSP0015_2-20120614/25495_1 /TAXON_ID=2838 /ORGANISM="Odontella" /LENGTH=194 /DNA_ID=CAMNT_0000474271 /DNA_START=299 /DNA_END=879 /DNA_ORIENTATION=- /assembly_acc=CAM_ASM_000160
MRIVPLAIALLAAAPPAHRGAHAMVTRSRPSTGTSAPPSAPGRPFAAPPPSSNGNGNGNGNGGALLPPPLTEFAGGASSAGDILNDMNDLDNYDPSFHMPLTNERDYKSLAREKIHAARIQNGRMLDSLRQRLDEANWRLANARDSVGAAFKPSENGRTTAAPSPPSPPRSSSAPPERPVFSSPPRENAPAPLP